MRHLILILCMNTAFFTACRTPGHKGSGRLKQTAAASCDPKGLLAELAPGGLFATKRVLYNQPRVEKEWIHPVMVEKQSPNNLGLFHSFVPDDSQAKKIKKITGTLTTLTKDTMATPNTAVKITADAAELSGTDSRVNVFKIDGEALLKVKALKFKVPSKSSSIVILTGQTPALKSVLISGDVSPDKVLFVLPEAGTFRVQGEKFLGTIVAPDTAVFMESGFTGSIYAGEISVREPMARSFYSGCIVPQKK